MKARYKKIKLKNIIFKEELRQRTSYNKIDELADSIREKGLMQAIGVVEETNVLVWGGRRLLAMQRLLLDDTIARIVPSGLSELQIRELELEENIQRESLSWDEECDALKELDLLKKNIHGDQETSGNMSDWSIRKTAELLDKDPSGVSRDIALSHALEMIPELRQCKNKFEAQKVFSKMIEDVAIQQITTDADRQKSLGSAYKYAKSQYIVGNCIEGLKKLDPTVCNLAIVDPPYSVNLHQQKLTTDPMQEYVEVSTKDYINLITEVSIELYRTLAENAWIIWWFGIEHYEKTYKILTKAGFKIDAIPGIWGKIESTGQTNHPELYLGRAYEQFFIGRKGNPSIVKQGKPNLFLYKPTSPQYKIHPTEKPIELCLELLDIFAFPGSMVIIPFLGSGVDLQAVYRKDLTGFGWDLSKDYRAKFLLRISEDIENGILGGKNATT